MQILENVKNFYFNIPFLKERDFEAKWEAERLIRESKQEPSDLKYQRKKYGSTWNVVKRKKTGVVHWINFNKRMGGTYVPGIGNVIVNKVSYYNCLFRFSEIAILQ